MTATSPPPVCGTCGHEKKMHFTWINYPGSTGCYGTKAEGCRMPNHPFVPSLPTERAPTLNLNSTDSALIVPPTESAPPLYDAALGDPTRHEQWTESATTTVPDEIAWVIVRNPPSLGLSYFTGFNGDWHTAWSRNHGDAQRFTTRADATRVLQDGIDHGDGAFRPDARVEEHMWSAAPLGEPPSEPRDDFDVRVVREFLDAQCSGHYDCHVPHGEFENVVSSRSALVADHRALGDECAALVAHRNSLEDRVRALTEEVRRLRAERESLRLAMYEDEEEHTVVLKRLRAALTPSPEQAAP